MKTLTRIAVIKIDDRDGAIYRELRRGKGLEVARGRIIDARIEKGNVILDYGAQYIWWLVTGHSGTIPFDSSNACIGVGDSDEPEDPSQLGLLGENKYYKGMDSGYPLVSLRKVTFRSTFGPDEANFHWYEIAIANACSIRGTHLNRRQVDLGEKQSGQTWVAILVLEIQ